MEGIYTDDPLLYDADPPEQAVECSPPPVSTWDGWTDPNVHAEAEDPDVTSTISMIERGKTLLSSPSIFHREDMYSTDSIAEAAGMYPKPAKSEDGLKHPRFGPQQLLTAAMVQKTAATVQQTAATVQQSEAQAGGEATTTAADEPLLTRRGLPMRHAAMKVAARVASIVSWENATEDSKMVRDAALAIDRELENEVSCKRRRVSANTTTEGEYNNADDSECDDGADDGDSETYQCSEPDPDDLDMDFLVADGETVASAAEDGEDEESESESESESDDDAMEDAMEDDESESENDDDYSEDDEGCGEEDAVPAPTVALTE
ncbi:hypothetical protein T484DRAFT_1756807 [Baffinella frigidus]|nr:hypothetical protein T484DRAFT_1756807 [Cryptophyta sp. CCMP2293]